jgi:hypothetical protein
MTDVRLLALLLAVLVGCQTAPKPKAPSDRDELAALLLSIPAECVAISPLDVVECAPAPPDPEGACVVERFDVGTKRLTDRLVYVGEDLVREEQVISSHTREDLTLRYDALHRLVEKRSCFAAGTGEPEWSPSWRPPMAVFDAPMKQASRTALSYVGDTRRPRFAQSDSTSGADSDRMKLCYAYDAAGNRSRRFQTFRTNRPAELQVNVRAYTWQGAKLSSVVVKDLVLKGQAIARRGGSRTDYAYDKSGRVLETSGTSTIPYRYDERGRFIAFGQVTFDWDDAGRLAGFHPGDPALDAHFTWDGSGRIVGAKFVSGDGFEVKYGARCAAGFSPPPVTPDVEGYLTYDGKDEL